MTPHSFGYMTVIAAETLIVAVLALCVWRLARQLRLLRAATSEKLSSTTAKALAHFMEECELPLPPERPLELPDLPDIPEQTAPADLPPALTKIEAAPAPSPAPPKVEVEVQPAVSRKRRQCSHRRRPSVAANNDAGATSDLRVRKSVRPADEPADEAAQLEAQIA